LLAVSLQLRLLLAFSFLIVLAAGFLVYFHLHNSRVLMGAIGEDLQAIGNTVHLSSQTISSENGADRQTLESFVRDASARKNVREVHVVGSNQKIVASSNPEQVGRAAKLTGREIVLHEELGQRDSSGHGIRYLVRVPILRDHQVIGVVQTAIVLRDFRGLVRQTLVRNLVVALAALLLAFFASSYVLHLLSRPLHRITLAAERVAGGDLSVRLPTLGRNDEASRLNSAFNVMVERLSERRDLEDRLRSLERQALVAEMSASLAHEIRNPLNLINLTAGHLDESFAPQEPARRAEYGEILKSLRGEVKHLNGVVHHFLSMSRPGRLALQTFPLAAVLEDTKVLIRQHLTARGIELRIAADASLTLRADEGQMRLLFLNLFLNAAEASPDKGRIQVEAFKSGEERATVIRISDEGAGIVPEDAERIFDAYHTRKEAGIGLGLALVRRIAEEHHGLVKAWNRPEGGACFETRIPETQNG